MADIPVNDLTPRSQLVSGAGTVTFSYNFLVTDQDDMIVEHTVDATGVTSTLILTTDYSVTGVNNATGGTVVLVVGAALDDIITISRDVAFQRPNDYPTQGDFAAATVNAELDLMILMMQQLERDLARSLRLSSFDTSTGLVLPTKEDRADKYLFFDSNGDPIAAVNLDITPAVVSPYMETVIDDATAEAALATLKAVGRQTIWIPAAAIRPTVSNPCTVLTDLELVAGRPDLQVLDFVDAGDTFGQFSIAFPRSWDRGVLHARFFWAESTGVATTVLWSIQAIAKTNNDPIAGVAYPAATTIEDTALGTANDLIVSDLAGPITAGGTPIDEDLVYFRVGRDVSGDTMTQDARLIGIQLYYSTDVGLDD